LLGANQDDPFEREIALEVGLPDLLLRLTYTMAKVGEVIANAQGARVVTEPATYDQWLAMEAAKSGKSPDPPPAGTRSYEIDDFFEPSVQRYIKRQKLEHELSKATFTAELDLLRDIQAAVSAGSLNAAAAEWIQPHLHSIKRQLELS
jgi:hypothetical protein